MSLLRETGNKVGVTFDQEQYDKSLPYIQTQLKALIARDLWDMNEFYQVMNTTNESLDRALQVINSNEYDQILSNTSK